MKGALLLVLIACGTEEPGGPPDAGLTPAVDPGYPNYPATVGTVSVAVLTGPGVNDGTDANEISLCLTATDCFRLFAPDIDNFRRGELDVYHVYNVDLPRAAIDRVELRSVNGTDMWSPDCLAVQLDGEPVYCEHDLGMLIGNGVGELQSWVDPEALHADCASCGRLLTHGPMLGAVEPDRARVWVRTDATRRVGLRMGASPDLADAVTVAWLYPSPVDDYAGVLTAPGLAPSTRYYFEVDVDGEAPGPIRSVVTAPPVGEPGRVTMAMGSCARLDAQPIFATISDFAPDLFLFLGDAHYGNTDDLDSLRWFYRWSLDWPERAALLAATPTIATWDDHDFVGNNTLGSEPGKDVALDGFREYWANPASGTPTLPGVFYVYRYRDVDVFMLDDRYWRGFDDSVLGAAQTDWLIEGLAASTATFKLVATGSQWTANGSTDSWAAYLPARDALFDAIVARGVEGVVLLSGDVHRSELRSIPRRQAGGYDLPELTASPLANTNFLCNPDGAEVSLLRCVDVGNFFIHLDIDTSLADPLLAVAIVDEAGAIRGSWAIRRSWLELP